MPPDERHPALGPGDEDYLVERDVRLSDSLLWDLQRRFYAAQDGRAWGSGLIPSYVTTNAWVARAYARLLVHLMLDLGSDEPVTILEVGAGSGRLGFLVLRELEALRPLCGEALPAFRYVLSDLSQATVAAWQAHPRLARWLESGLLELARLDLARAPLSLELDLPPGPLVVVANYVLDALVQDAFRVQEGCLQEGRVSLLADHPGADPGEPGLLDGVAALFGWRPLPPGPYYSDPELEALLRGYPALLHRGAFGFPLGALRVIDRLQQLGGGSLVLLSTDKGWSQPQQLVGRSAPQVMTHGSLSMMVDHHAIGRWVQARGGQCLMSSPRHGSVESALFALGHDRALPLTRLAFDSELEAQSPADFVGVAEAMAAEHEPDLERVLGLLRLGAWDPMWLRTLLPAIEATAPRASIPLRRELGRALDQVERRLFAVPGEGGRDRAALERARATV